MPLGAYAVTTSRDADLAPGIIFCLQTQYDPSTVHKGGDYPLSPYYLVHVGDDATVLLPHTQAKRLLDRLKRLALGRELPDAAACARFDHLTRHGQEMRHAQQLLAAAMASVVGKHQEKAIASLFSPGGTHARAGEFAGRDDVEVIAFMVILPAETT